MKELSLIYKIWTAVVTYSVNPLSECRSDDAKSRMEDDHTRMKKKILFPNRTPLILFPASEFTFRGKLLISQINKEIPRIEYF